MPFPSRSILVATDLSDRSRGVVDTAGSLARLSGADLHAVHAIEAEGGGDAGRSEEGESHRAASRALQAHLRKALPAGVDAVSARVEIGRPDDVILRRAQEVAADLIIIGPHRRTRGPDREFGTTADRLVRAADVPCLVVHDRLSLPLRSVLIPSDLSDAGRGALDLGLTWSAALRLPSRGDEQTAVEVLHVRGSGAEGPPGEARNALDEEVRGGVERSGIGSLLGPDPRLLEAADPVEAIVQRTKAIGADLLVLGTHGRSAGARHQVGSISSAVARMAECPVLLVPPAFWKPRQERERTIREASRGDGPSG